MTKRKKLDDFLLEKKFKEEISEEISHKIGTTGSHYASLVNEAVTTVTGAAKISGSEPTKAD